MSISLRQLPIPDPGYQPKLYGDHIFNMRQSRIQMAATLGLCEECPPDEVQSCSTDTYAKWETSEGFIRRISYGAAGTIKNELQRMAGIIKEACRSNRPDQKPAFGNEKKPNAPFSDENRFDTRVYAFLLRAVRKVGQFPNGAAEDLEPKQIDQLFGIARDACRITENYLQAQSPFGIDSRRTVTLCLSKISDGSTVVKPTVGRAFEGESK